MGELVGLHLEKAGRLLRDMKDASAYFSSEVVGQVRHGLRVAQDDAGAEAQSAPLRLMSYKAFLDRYISDLNRAIHILSNLPDDRLTTSGDLTQATISSESEARTDGRNDGQDLREAWEEFKDADQERDRLDKRQAFIDAVAAAQDQMYDPAYAASFLWRLGGEDVKEIIENFEDLDIHADLDEKLAPLSQLVATADQAGTLPPTVHDGIMESLEDEQLQQQLNVSTFLRLAPRTSEGIVGDALTYVLDHANLANSTGRRSIVNMVAAAKDHPELMQEVLANDEYRDEILFEPSLLDPHDEYEEVLADAVDSALTAGNGDAELQQEVWTALVKKGNEDGFRDRLNDHPQLAQAMARHFKEFLAYAGHEQARELGEDYEEGVNVPERPDGFPRLEDVSVDDMTNFIGALASDPDAMKELTDEAETLTSQGLREIPSEVISEGSLNADVRGALAQNQGVMAILLAGIQAADIDEQTRRDRTADALQSAAFGGGGLLLDVAPGGGAIGTVVEVEAGEAVAPAFQDLADWVHRGDEQIDTEEFYDRYKDAYRDLVRDYLTLRADSLPAGERPSDDEIDEMVVGVVTQFETLGLREMLEEFWRGF